MPRTIILAIETTASPDQIFSALSTPEGLESFWTPDVTVSDDGSYRFGFEAAPVPLEMTVESTIPDRQVRWICGGPWPYWADTTVEWTISASDGGAMVLLRHSGWADTQPEVEFGSVALTWAMVLQALKAYSESGTPAPALA